MDKIRQQLLYEGLKVKLADAILCGKLTLEEVEAALKAKRDHSSK